MSDYVIDLLGESVGILINGLIIYGLVRLILFKFIDGKTLIFVSFIGACIIELVLNSFLNGFVYGFVRYIPAVFILSVVDLIRLNKKEKAPTH